MVLIKAWWVSFVTSGVCIVKPIRSIDNDDYCLIMFEDSFYEKIGSCDLVSFA
jgi:hypothetical protein